MYNYIDKNTIDTIYIPSNRWVAIILVNHNSGHYDILNTFMRKVQYNIAIFLYIILD